MNSEFLIKITALISGTIFLVYISRKALFSIKEHGFYRFFAFECCFCLILLNVSYWVTNPFSLLQIFSWIFLITSGYLILSSIQTLKKSGGSGEREIRSANFKFEDTVNLVSGGVYKYIRHPMYSSVLFLCIGALLKNISALSALSAALTIIFLFLTAKTEESENIKFFGSSYSEYMKGTKMFIPFIF